MEGWRSSARNKKARAEGAMIMRTSHKGFGCWLGLAAMLIAVGAPLHIKADDAGSNATVARAIASPLSAQGSPQRVYNPPSASSDGRTGPVNMTEMAVRLGGTLLLVLAAFFLAVRIFRRSPLWGMAQARPSHLNIVESRTLGSRHSLHVVTYGRQRFLIADSPAGTRFLAPLDEPPAGEFPQPDGPANDSFADKLRSLIEGPQSEPQARAPWGQRLKAILAGKVS